MNELYIENIIKFSYKVDKFQKDSIDAILKGENVLVTAHTSAGKSTIAEFAIAMSSSQGKRSIYTSPIKALSNQKYGDFQKKKGIKESSIGILTGDIKVNPDGDVLVATTEIVNNLLYTNIEYFDNVKAIVLDEVHYIRDNDRGHVWEEVISMMPKHVILVMLSASIPGAEGFCRWVEEIKGKKCHLISTSYRPVPLVHKLYWNGICEQVVKNTNEIDCQRYKLIYNNWKEINSKKIKDRESCPTMLKKCLEYLETNELFPALFFVFSRKQTEKLAGMIQRSFLDGKQQTDCLNMYEFYVKKYLGEAGMQLSQVWKVRSFLAKGVCIHHSGLIPILKEIIETLFDKGWIKIMFVTETFSVGINMPTKCVVFGELQKFDGHEQRCLNPEEYCQMAGRAGRRGKDTLGTVIYFPIPPKDMITLSEFSSIVKGKHSSVVSKFKMDPVLLLKCIETDRAPSELFESTLMNQEIKDCIKGINIELSENNKNLNELGIITNESYEGINEIKRLETSMRNSKPNKRKKLQFQIKNLKSKYETDLVKYDKINKLKNDISKLEKNLDDAKNYISQTCEWQKEVLVNTGYLSKEGIVSLKGRCCSMINESDSFLTTEYLTKLFERLNDFNNLKTCMSFIIGSLIDEKELNKEENEENLVDICITLGIDNSCVKEIEYEMNNLKEIFNTLHQEERLRDMNYCMTPMFGFYCYLWTINGCNYNEIQEKLCGSLYEGNFVRSMLKMHNICEEWKSISEIYQHPEFSNVINEIQGSIIRDIVIVDSLYIAS